MTYLIFPLPAFWVLWGILGGPGRPLLPVQLVQPLNGPLQHLRARMHIALRNRNAAVAGKPHDGEGIGPGLSEPGEHGMPERMQYEIGRKLQEPAHCAMLMVKTGGQKRIAR